MRSLRFYDSGERLIDRSRGQYTLCKIFPPIFLVLPRIQFRSVALTVISSTVILTSLFVGRTGFSPNASAEDAVMSTSSFSSVASSEMSSSINSSLSSSDSSLAPADLRCACDCLSSSMNLGKLCLSKSEAEREDKDKKCDTVFSIITTETPSTNVCNKLNGQKCIGYIPKSGNVVDDAKLRGCVPAYKG